MSRFEPNIAVVSIAGTKFALEDTQSALELMAILSKAIQLDDYTYSVREYTDCSYCLQGDPSSPELKWVRASQIDGHRTREEIKEQGERAKKDREDQEAQVREITEKPALPAPEE